MAALNIQTPEAAAAAQQQAARERLVNSLYPPVREIVLAVDEIKAARNARDLERMGRAVRSGNARVAEYLEVVQS